MTIKQKIKKKFVKAGNIQWPRDMKAARSLLEKFPDESFWEWIEPYPLVDMLPFLLTQKNIQYLEDKYKIFLNQQDSKNKKKKLEEALDKKEDSSHNLAEPKVGEDKVFVRKPKTVKEFLSYGKTSETS